ncbi:MAG: hypothetical protein L0Y79_11825 [Chlorobi bacterium]|nr:hypothetical protein [Chlorobiota bacterium]MCI0715857.1 hypothetical protein [Chlorobiota bacterium]
MNFQNIKQQIEDHETRLSKLEKLLSGNTTPEKINKKISLREFLNSVNANKEIQKALSICYYLEKYQELESFNLRDLEIGYREAKEPIPQGNLPYKLFMLVKKGWIMEAKDKKDGMKAYVSTNSAALLVENGFKKNS